MSICFFASTRFSTSWYLLIWATAGDFVAPFCGSVVPLKIIGKKTYVEFYVYRKEFRKFQLAVPPASCSTKKKKVRALWLDRKKSKNYHRSPPWRQFASRCITTKPAPTIKNIWIESTSYSLTVASKKLQIRVAKKKIRLFSLFFTILSR